MATANSIRVHVVRYPDRKNLVMRYTDPSNGKQVQRSTGTNKKREAERIAAKWEADLQEGRYRKPGGMMWEEFIDRYDTEVLSGLADKTAPVVYTVFNSVERILNPQHLREMTTDRISVFQSTLRKENKSEATIRTYLAHLRSSLSWAHDLELIAEMPKIERPKRARQRKVMKGRPITTEEFERMLMAVDILVKDKRHWMNKEAAPSWKFHLDGLWYSGLRLQESLVLSWDPTDTGLYVEMCGKYPTFRISAEAEKGNTDRILAMSPEFANLLAEVSVSDRKGRVFKLVAASGDRAPMTEDWVGRVVSKLGDRAGVMVNDKKHASAQDLRRSFGERWAARVMPNVLQELMRHESIDTTMRFYVGQNAQRTADILWNAIGTTLGIIGKFEDQRVG